MADNLKERNIDFDKVIDRKNTDSLKYDFAARRGKPEDVLPLWVADMDFKTSSFILDAIKDRVDHGIFGYTETNTRYFEVVSGWLKRHHDIDVEEKWLVKTPGVVFALATAVKAYTKEGEAVIIQEPVYYPFSGVVRENHRKLVVSDLVIDENGKYQIDFEDFENKIVENDVKLFIFCSPHNPVGRVWTVEELKKLIDICLKHEVIIVSDEIHFDFVFEGYTHTSIINADERIKDSCVLATSPGKTFNLAGLQVSNIFIPNPKLRKAFKDEVDATGYCEMNTLGLVACETAYKYGETWYEALKKYLQENLDFVRSYLESELPKVKLVEPEGTYLIWLDFRGLGLSEAERKDLIENKAKLWLDTGTMFGEAGAGFERINITAPRSVIKEALDRIKNAVRNI